MAPGVATVKITGNVTEALAALDTLGLKIEEVGGKADRSFSGASKALAAGLGAGALVESVKKTVEWANAQEDAHARLQKAVSNSGASMAGLAPQVEAADKRMEKFGYTNAQTEDALGSLVTALGDPKKALEALGTAADVAAYKHVPLADAAIAVAKGMEGNLRPLKQMGIDLPVVASSAEKVKVAQENLSKAQATLNEYMAKHPDAVNASSKAHAGYEKALGAVQTAQQKLSDQQTAGGQIMDALNKKVGGQAATAADTFSGKMAALKAQGEDLGAKFGTVLIPKLEDLAKYTSDVVNWFERHKAVAEALAGTIGGVLAVAVGAFAVNKLADFAHGVKDSIDNLSKFASTAESAAQTVLQKFGLIKKATDDVGNSASGATGKVQGLGSAAATSGGEAATAAGEESGLAGSETAAGGAASTATGEVAGLGAAEATTGAEAATAAGEEDAFAAASRAAAGLSGAGALAGGALVGGGAAAMVGITGYGLYMGINPEKAISDGAARASGFGMYSGAGYRGPVGGYNFNPALGGMGLGGLNLSGLGGLNFSGLPGRAGGGPVYPGQPYIVGENGPELFIPSTGGTINPGSPGGTPAAAGGQNITVNMLGETSDPHQMAQQLAWEIKPYLASTF